MYGFPMKKVVYKNAEIGNVGVENAELKSIFIHTLFRSHSYYASPHKSTRKVTVASHC